MRTKKTLWDLSDARRVKLSSYSYTPGNNSPNELGDRVQNKRCAEQDTFSDIFETKGSDTIWKHWDLVTSFLWTAHDKQRCSLIPQPAWMTRLNFSSGTQVRLWGTLVEKAHLAYRMDTDHEGQRTDCYVWSPWPWLLSVCTSVYLLPLLYQSVYMTKSVPFAEEILL